MGVLSKLGKMESGPFQETDVSAKRISISHVPHVLDVVVIIVIIIIICLVGPHADHKMITCRRTMFVSQGPNRLWKIRRSTWCLPNTDGLIYPYALPRLLAWM